MIGIVVLLVVFLISSSNSFNHDICDQNTENTFYELSKISCCYKNDTEMSFDVYSKYFSAKGLYT